MSKKVAIQLASAGPLTETVWITLSHETGDWRVTRVEGGQLLDEHDRTRLLEMAVAFVALHDVKKVTVTLAT